MPRMTWRALGAAIVLVACGETEPTEVPPHTAVGGAGGSNASGGTAAAGGSGHGGAGGSACAVVFSDSYEQGLDGWTFSGANHERSDDFAHTGQYSHKIWDIGTLDEIAYVDFEPPDAGALYVGFWWLVDGAYTNSPGKLARLVSAGLVSQLEMWCTTDSWSPGVHWYGGSGCEVAPDGLCCRWPGVSQQDPRVWHHNEVFIEYEIPGQSTGRFRQWIDRPDDVPISQADAYLTADESGTRFMGDGSCTPYSSLRLPTNIDGQFQGGFIYYDDVEIRGCLP